MEYETVRDTLSQNIHFWSPNHVLVAMNKVKSFLEKKKSWLSLEAKPSVTRQRRVSWR